MKQRTALAITILAVSAIVPLYCETSARTISYHSQDIANIRARIKFTTLIQLPPTEKIIEAAHLETPADDGMRWEPDANYHDGDCPACGHELGSNASICETCADHDI